MIRLILTCAALGSALMATACGSSSSGGTGAGGAGQASGGAGQTPGGTGQTSAGAGQTSGGSPATGGVSSSVPGSKVLGTLTDAEATTLCMDLAKSPAVASLDDFTCRTAGILAALLAPTQTDAAIQAACQTSYDECIANPSSGVTTMCDSKPSAACMATVAEYEACLADELAQVQQLSAQIPSCSQLTAANASSALASLPQGMTPASCATAQQKCPELGQ